MYSGAAIDVAIIQIHFKITFYLTAKAKPTKLKTCINLSLDFVIHNCFRTFLFNINISESRGKTTNNLVKKFSTNVNVYVCVAF